MTPMPTLPASPSLAFVRHGATVPNLEGLRCGGDLDVPLTDIGREQITRAAQGMRDAGWAIDLIVASDLERTRESARIVAAILGGVRIVIDAGWRERSLGEWNLHPVAESERALRSGRTPPGGESNAVFTARISNALTRLVAGHTARQPLLVGSKGVARVLGELLGTRHDVPVDNGRVLCFDLGPLRHATAASAAPARPLLASGGFATALGVVS